MKLPCLTALIGAVVSQAWADPAVHRVFHHENVLGTSLELRIVASTDAAAKQAETTVLAEIDGLEDILSTYRADSDFSHWLRTAGEPVRIAPELQKVLSLFDRWQERSHGALNAGAEAVAAVWREAAREQRLPTDAEIRAAVELGRLPHWRVDLAAGTATHLSEAPLTLDAAGKGWIIDRAGKAALTVDGVEAVVLNLGGDVVVRGSLSEPVDIADPHDPADNASPIARVTLRDQAVATSGGYRRGFEIGGRHYSHIIDPRTGRPVDHVVSASVVAPEAGDADALATTFSVLPPAESLALAADLPGVECLLFTADGRSVASPGWNNLTAPASPAMAGEGVAASAESTAATVAGEVVIRLELARIQNQRAARPFVAVWIEDQDRYPVRTLALWFNSPRWLPDLRGWYQDEQLRALAEGTSLIPTVSSATRAPGRYTLKWDGRDNAGKPVKPGKYTVLIEASREHGTYQLMRQELSFPGAFAAMELPGNLEVSSASLEYRPTTEAR